MHLFFLYSMRTVWHLVADHIYEMYHLDHSISPADVETQKMPGWVLLPYFMHLSQHACIAGYLDLKWKPSLLPFYSFFVLHSPWSNCICFTVYILLLWGSLGAVQWSSHLGLVSSASSVLLEAGWIRWQCQISDINHQSLPPPLFASSHFSLLSSSASHFFFSSHHLVLLLSAPSDPPKPAMHAHPRQQPTGRQCRLCYEWHPLAHPEEVYSPVWFYKLSPLS